MITIHKKKILVVDDDPEIRKLLCLIVENHSGINPETAGNGHEAFEMIIDKPFDLILSDFDMPLMSGLSLLSKIKIHFLTPPPFILISGNLDITPKKVFELGGDAFVEKPFKLHTIESILEKYI